ncbi:hypothetical protein CDAR_483391, partial [Caerostris darwini]
MKRRHCIGRSGILNETDKLSERTDKLSGLFRFPLLGKPATVKISKPLSSDPESFGNLE